MAGIEVGFDAAVIPVLPTKEMEVFWNFTSN
jgi:hypothetical protein